MCAAYGAAPGLSRALAGLATQNPGGRLVAPLWYGETIPDDFGIYAVLEDAASDLAGYAFCQVPGLLRTEAYARTLITSTGLRGEEVDRLVYAAWPAGCC